MSVRPPAVAGLFYPASPAALASDVDAHLVAPAPHAPAPAPQLRALVVPHAGYVYSGPTAGVAYRLLPALAGRVRRVLLLGPPHRVPVWGVQVSAADAWQTPLGVVHVDAAARDALVAADRRHESTWVGVGDSAHGPEHCLEVQLPFLQRTLPDVPVLPVLVGQADPEQIASLLDPWWTADTMIIVSTDLSHYEPDDVARRHDAATASAVVERDATRIGDHDACGAQPLRVLLHMATAHDAKVRELDRRTSADTAGDPERVVGYGSFAVEQ